MRDVSPLVEVQAAEYQRLLGYPRGRVLGDRALELATASRAWYARHGRPWIYARESRSLEIGAGTITVDGVPFAAGQLRTMLSDAGAESVVLVAVGAGAEIAREAQRLWDDEKPDEYFFLEIFGSAVVEHLVAQAGARLCAAADGERRAVLPHYSPGYPTWEITEQGPLLSLLQNGGDEGLPRELEAMESGMLRPKKSLLAVFGVTPHVDRVQALGTLVPCENCSLPRCDYRRRAYRGPRRPSEVEAMSGMAYEDGTESERAEQAPLNLHAQYSVSAKALRRWASERLTIASHDDGTTDALFRYEGTTCANASRAFEFHYAVTLGRREEHFPVLDQRCEPAPGDVGHTFMCRYRAAAPQLMERIAEE
ncbi:MAG: hypothetical protein H0W68_03390, partial [Gemmatimonadaceae bacterium]|nr:hypothetical protein [Gemmatimonadaceae bacterium]